jgi:hypothetical protein
LSELNLHYETLQANVTESMGCVTLHFPADLDRKLEKYADGIVNKRSYTTVCFGEVNMASTDDLLLNEDVKSSKTFGEAEILPTRKILKMQ